MKNNWLTGIFSGMMLVCVLVGNTFYMAYYNGKTAQVMAKQPDILHSQPVESNPTADTNQSSTVRLPVLMYHHLLKNTSRSGDYVITPDQFEADLQEIQARNYTPITFAQLNAYYEGSQPLPEKPILITFDDGYETVYEYAFPLLQKYNMPASVMIIGKYTDLYSTDVTKGLSYAHVSWQELEEMTASGLFEVGNHTYELHSNEPGTRKGIRKLESETLEQYREKLFSDIGSLNNEIIKELEIEPTVFAYPFGAFSPESDEILKELGFRYILTCEEKVNQLDAANTQADDIVKLKRFNRPSKLSTWEMFEKFE